MYFNSLALLADIYIGVEDITWLCGEIYNISLQVLENLSLFSLCSLIISSTWEENFCFSKGPCAIMHVMNILF